MSVKQAERMIDVHDETQQLRELAPSDYLAYLTTIRDWE